MANDSYLLTRDEEEAQRLNKQHQVFLLNNGYVIHPSLEERMPNAAAVADVAAGSGAWTLDVASRLSPESRVDGYDISADGFPAKHPNNVTFSVQDAREPFPTHLHGTYDLVHVRALVAAMDRSDWERVVANLSAIVKPGGALQWTEADLSRLVALRSGTATATPFTAIDRLIAMFHEVSRQRTDYGARELPKLLEHAGFESVRLDCVSSDRVPETRATLTETYLIAMLGWAKKSGAMAGAELDNARRQVMEEVANGAYLRGDMFTTIGIKL